MILSTFNRSRLLMLACCLTMLGAFAAPAPAQTLALVPAEVDLPVQASKPAQFEIQVSNRGSSPVPAKVAVTDLWYNDKNEKTFGAPGTSPRSAANWIEFVPRQFTIPANGSAVVKVLVTPPANISGGYYAVVFVESKPELVQSPSERNNNRAVFANIRLGSLILLKVEDGASYQAKIGGATLTPPAQNHDLQVSFSLNNTGNTHLFPQAKLAILDSHHDLVATAQGEIKRFLPGQKDSMEIHWDGGLPSGVYTGILTVLYGKDRVYTQEIPFSTADFRQAMLGQK